MVSANGLPAYDLSTIVAIDFALCWLSDSVFLQSVYSLSISFAWANNMPSAAEDDPQLYPRSERLYSLVDGPETPEPSADQS